MLKTPVRAEMSTATVWLMHTLAAAEPTRITRVKADFAIMFALCLVQSSLCVSVLARKEAWSNGRMLGKRGTMYG